MRTSVIICLFAGYAALLSARVGGAPQQAPSQPPLPENNEDSEAWHRAR